MHAPAVAYGMNSLRNRRLFIAFGRLSRWMLCALLQPEKAQHLRLENSMQGLKFVYNKSESQLRITGMFKMF